MHESLRLSLGARELLRCPVCGCRLDLIGDTLRCQGPKCRRMFPIVDGVPRLLDESRSVFSLDPSHESQPATGRGLRQAVARALPTLTSNVASAANYARLRQILSRRPSPVRVLIVGGQIAGQGAESLLTDEALDLIELDVMVGPRTSVVGDAHHLCLADESMDCVVIQAVLEHVLDPHRCVQEIHRVLKADGIVYAETPFLFPRHMGRHDFTRFTYLGHRRLFRQFEKIEDGIAVGPGSALALTYHSLLTGAARGRLMRAFLRAASILTGFWLKYLDWLLASSPGAYDCAGGFFFLGRKSEETLSDRALLSEFRGLE
ncbi:MAG: methyltransferase domain-containing protein [Candidatus Eiseniibacteriota bacterium]